VSKTENLKEEFGYSFIWIELISLKEELDYSFIWIELISLKEELDSSFKCLFTSYSL